MDRNLDFYRIEQKRAKKDFDEFPPCSHCGSTKNVEKFRRKSGFRIVECENCGLWFTSPRLDEKTWEHYLRYPYLPRNITVTEYRLHYGVSVESNIGGKKVGGGWRKRVTDRNIELLEIIQHQFGRRVSRLHDVGCGVGFLIQDANQMGIKASGNDLNGYACKIMKDEYGLDVYEGNLNEINIEKESIDVMIMNDFIEHTYHPAEDLRVARELLTDTGMLFLETFYIDSTRFENEGWNWGMLTWPHLYHFSRATLTAMLESTGFKVEKIIPKENGIMQIFARKN